MTTDTSEKGLESLIVAAMTGATEPSPCPPDEVCEPPLPFEIPCWIQGDPRDYDRAYAVDLTQLKHFLQTTQPLVVPSLDLDSDSPTRQKFLARLQGLSLIHI